MPDSSRPQSPTPRSTSVVTVCLAILGLLALVLSLVAAQSLQFNVANYTVSRVVEAHYWPATIFAGLLPASLIALCAWSSRSAGTGSPWRLGASFLWPLVFTIPSACFLFVNCPPPFALTWLVTLSAGWVALRAGACLRPVPLSRSAHPAALLSIVLLILAATILHTRIQINFFEHFMLGHSDIGHFTEELKNSLAGRGLRSDSFENTRLGWHFTPLLYSLAPGYALWPSPIYLMVCGPLLLHLPAIAVYILARRLSGSVRIGWLFAVTWLALPSLSRMVYSNTYGFAWVYMSVPLLAFMLTAFFTERRRTSIVLLLLVWMCEETTTAVTLGLGAYLAFFTPRRKTGLLIAVGSIVYYLLCVQVLIPHFAATGRYDRLDLFGDLGKTSLDLALSAFSKPDLFFSRLLRFQGFYFIASLIIPMAVLPLRGWRIALATVPTLALILLLQNSEWLSIKFWHQATILPVFFVACVVGATKASVENSPPSRTLHLLCGNSNASRVDVCRGLAAATLVCACFGHYFYGFSPVSRSYAVYANDPFLQAPDARLPAIRRLRSEIPIERTILATERLATHFTDYRRLYTGERVKPADFVVIDRSDLWDPSGLPGRWKEFGSDPDYRLYAEFETIIVFERRPEALPAPED